jgi:hypothetical protein
MPKYKFSISHRIIALLISVSLPIVSIPLSVVQAEETFPNLPQPGFHDISPAPTVSPTTDSSPTGATGGTNVTGGSSGAAKSGGMVGNLASSIRSSSENSVLNFALGILGITSVPKLSTTASKAQMGISAFSAVTTSLLSLLGFSLVVTGPIAILGFAAAVMVGLAFGGPHTGVSLGSPDLDAEGQGLGIDPADSSPPAAFEGVSFSQGRAGDEGLSEAAAAQAASDAAAAAAAQAATDATAAANPEGPGGGSCFKADSLILTEVINGKYFYRRLGNLKEGDYIVGAVFDAAGHINYKKAKILKVLAHEAKSYPFARLETKNGSNLVGTTNHPVITGPFNVGTRMEYLAIGQRVYSGLYSTREDILIKITRLPREYVPVYNLETETENYFVSQDGSGAILVHNGAGGGK